MPFITVDRTPTIEHFKAKVQFPDIGIPVVFCSMFGEINHKLAQGLQLRIQQMTFPRACVLALNIRLQGLGVRNPQFLQSLPRLDKFRCEWRQLKPEDREFDDDLKLRGVRNLHSDLNDGNYKI